MKRILITIAVLVALGAGCAKKPVNLSSDALPGNQAPAGRVQDATFVIDGLPVELGDGYSIVMDTPGSSLATVTRLFGEPVVADLDADGDLDAAVMLSRDSGGSGAFYYAAAAINDGGNHRGTGAVLLGDRIVPQTIEVRDAVIIANYFERKLGEPMTTRQSVGVSKYLRLESGELKEIPKP